jgi:hypothetical protein
LLLLVIVIAFTATTNLGGTLEKLLLAESFDIRTWGTA